MINEVMEPRVIARRAYDIFVPMLHEWRHSSHTEPSLVGAIGDSCAARVLEKDFRDIGGYLIAVDDRTTHIELSVVAACLSELREHSTQPGGGAVTLESLERDFDVQKHKAAESSFLPPPMVLTLPLCLRVARDLAHKGTPADAAGLKDMLVAFTRRIVLQDGNVTNHEAGLVREIEDFLTDMISNAV